MFDKVKFDQEIATIKKKQTEIFELKNTITEEFNREFQKLTNMWRKNQQPGGQAHEN